MKRKRVKTKDRILATALQLFNTQGLSKVSSKTISEVMGISYGNLCYHYPKKDDIVIKLYLMMQEEVDEQFQNIQRDILGFDFVMTGLRLLLEMSRKYKFIYLDFTNIVRRFDKIRAYANRQFQTRKVLLKGICDFLITEQYLQEETVSGHYDQLVHGWLLMFHTWLADAEIFYQGEEKDLISYYLEMFYSSIRSSLTPKGLKAFNEIYKAKQTRQI
ncbi:MAG: TetR/AcrR family transcriptional regulator [Chitinophagales bacterium]